MIAVDLEQKPKPQQSAAEEETVTTEKVHTEEEEKEEVVEEEEEEDIDDIVKRFERETESEASISEKEELSEFKEKEEEEVVLTKQEFIAENLKQDTGEMEFAKNYSDDLLMGQNDQAELPSASAGADLADFELPPYSGSSSGSEPRQHSPVKRKSSSSTSTAQQQASSSSKQVNVAPPDLTAVKNLLMSSYSKVSHIFHWKKPIETGLYFSIGATLIIALTFFSIISVVAYSALGLIAASSLIRLYKAVMMTLGKSTETPFDHVWDKVLSLNFSLSPDKMHQLLDASLGNLNSSFVYFKQVLLVEDKLATLKFGVFLYLLTYIGAWFNGMTLITITYLALFSVPIFYEKNKTKIDEYVNLASGQITSVINMVTGKVSSTLFGGNAASSSVSKKQN